MPSSKRPTDQSGSLLTDYDVAIIGGGPAGAATALFLSSVAPELSARTLIVDKDRFPREKVCAGAIGQRAVKALASIGVHLDVPQVSIHALSVSTRAGKRRFAMPQGRPIGRVIRRQDHDAALLNAARKRGVHVRESAKLTGLERHANGVTLQTTAGEIRAAIVVGADGIGSYVRRWLGLPRGRLYAQAVEVDTLPHQDDPPRDTLHFDLEATDLRGYAWDFPTVVDGEPMVCRGVYELVRGAGKPSDTDVTKRLEARLHSRGIQSSGLRFKRLAERGLSLHEPYGRDRVVLAGESAGIDPVLGEGIAQAILYGQAVGPYLARATREGDFSLTGYGDAIRRSRVGLDLSVRSRLPRIFYGRGRRIAERWLCQSSSLALAGMHYFAGERVPRAKLAHAGIDLLTASVAELR